MRPDRPVGADKFGGKTTRHTDKRDEVKPSAHYLGTYGEHVNITPAKRLAALRKVVESRTAAKIEGVLVDLFSASLIVQVYEALSERNKVIFAAMPIGQMGKVAFRLTNK